MKNFPNLLLDISYKKEIVRRNPLPEIFLRNSNEEYLAWLDSSREDKEIGRFSILGIKPLFTIKTDKNSITFHDKFKIFSSLEISKFEGNPNIFLKEISQKIKVEKSSLKIPFSLGLLGYFGYEYLEKEKQKKACLNTPDSFFMFPTISYVYDHFKKILYTIEIRNERTKERRNLTTINLRKVNEETKKIINKKIQLTYEISQKKYFDIFEKIQNKISDGEMYECCFTHKILLNGLNNLADLYLDLRVKNPASFSAFLRFDGFTVLSSSPERFLKLEDRKVEMRPIKGTIKRGINKAEDKKNQTELEQSLKNRAENIMIVDLIRNDLGRISEFNSVKVKKLFKVEKYASLFQLVSVIESKLKKNEDIFSALEATFPGGSMTGAPKIRAMEYIKKYETTKRGIYSGSIGYIDISGNSDLNIVIRTIIHDEKKQKAYLGVGGALVYDSSAISEYEESILKASKIIETIESKRNIRLTR